MKRNWLSFLATFATAATVAACSSSTPTAPNPTPTTLSPVVPNTGASGLTNAEIPLFTVAGAGTYTGQGACTFNPSTGQFVCPDQSHGGLTVTSRFTLYDRSGNVQTAFDPATTASIKTETTASGTVSIGDNTVSINRSGVMTVSGLGPNATTHTLNGTEQGP